MAPVGLGDYNNHRFTGKMGFIDKTGKEIVQCEYDTVRNINGD